MAHKKPVQRRETMGFQRISPQQSHLPTMPAGGVQNQRLEVVLKSDSFGTSEAVEALIHRIKVPEVEIRVIHSGVGPISKSDLLMALSGSKLVLGFNVGIMPKLDLWVKEHGVEVRLYQVIYRLAEDLKEIAQSLAVHETEEEKITGKAKVIALFKSTHGGIILGCMVEEGTLAVGKNFRVIAAMGPVYAGKIESLHIGKDSVKEAKPGQQVGVKIEDFKKGKIGDLVECFETLPPKKSTSWKPSGSVLHLGE